MYIEPFHCINMSISRTACTNESGEPTWAAALLRPPLRIPYSFPMGTKLRALINYLPTANYQFSITLNRILGVKINNNSIETIVTKRLRKDARDYTLSQFFYNSPSPYHLQVKEIVQRGHTRSDSCKCQRTAIIWAFSVLQPHSFLVEGIVGTGNYPFR